MLSFAKPKASPVKQAEKGDEEQVVANNSKKRALVDEDEVTVIEETLPLLPKAPVSATASAKKKKLDDGKAQAVAPKDEEVKEEIVVSGPPKDIEKLRPPSSPAYHPIEDAPFYKGQPVPFSFLTRALSEIETCKG